ncbi:hypothetical protein FB451DRAFT_1567276 [Mycena latifolia]|nr:hypothetical protein FB451DRAFT_1567276 [Mycena latifolia]
MSTLDGTTGSQTYQPFFGTQLGTSAFQSASKHRSYADVARDDTMPNQPPVPLEVRAYSKAELHVGNIPLAHTVDPFQISAEDRVLAFRAALPPAYSMAELNVGSMPLLRDRDMQAPKPIGFGRPIAMPPYSEEPVYFQYPQQPTADPTSTGVRDDTARHGEHSTLFSSCAWSSFPVFDAHGPLSPEEMQPAFYPYLYAHPPRDWTPAPPSVSPLYLSNSSGSWDSSPSLASTTTTMSSARSHSPPLPVVPNARRRKYHGPFDTCSREDVLQEFADDCDTSSEDDAPLELEARLAALRALANWPAQARFGETDLRATTLAGTYDGNGNGNGWSAPSLISTATTISYTLPPSPPLAAPPKPHRRKYHGPFDACSREDVLPEFWDDDDPSPADDAPLNAEVRLAAFRALVGRTAGDDQKLRLRTPDATDEGGNGWSLLEMEHHTTAVRNRLLAAYHTHLPPPELVPTALRGLPRVVQARPEYPQPVWGRILAELESQCEWVQSRM